MTTRGHARRSSQRVLVTGGCGFLGCNLAAELAERGRTVLVLDNLSRPGVAENAEWLRARHGDRIDIETGDVRDDEMVEAAVGQVSAVMHLAGQVAVTTSLDRPLEDYEINIGGTLRILEAVRRRNPRAPVIFASTNKVYGKLLEREAINRIGSRYMPIDERLAHGVTELQPLDFYSPYGCSKGAADQYVRDYARVFGLRTGVLRMSCIYGPRQFGTEDQGWIAHFLIQAIRGQPLTIYGDGCQVRDALFVGDAVDAWIGMLDRIEDVAGSVFNLGGGPENSVSLRELLDQLAEIRGEPPRVQFGPWRPGDQPWYVSDVRAISRALNWAPRTRLPEGLRSLEQWLSTRFSQRSPIPEPHAVGLEVPG